jgi:hypothetical protein
METMRIIKKQTLSDYAIRSVCVEESLFTRGTNEQYKNMFRYANKLFSAHPEIRTEDLYDIADYIAAFSELLPWKTKTGLGAEEFVAHIMWCLHEKIQTSFEIYEELN